MMLDGTVGEVGNHTRLEALVYVAEVVALAVLKFKVALLAFVINGIILGVGLEVIGRHSLHDETAVITMIVRVLEQSGLNIVGGHLLALNHIEDTSIVELIGDEVLIDATCGLHLRVGIDGALEQHGGSHGHVEFIHRDVALQRGQRIVRTITAYGTLQSE